ncbi:MAG TPA: hypothetical protein PKD85_20005, partial [Saprospiraceae bacterium]|nr:hypothetical protein [Saprospiraceae bacterium]
QFYHRNKVITLEEIVLQLVDITKIDKETCTKYVLDLLQWANNINEIKRESNDRNAYIPFRLHQFISQTGSVYVTLEPKELREITLEPGYYKTSLEEGNIKIYPVMFSRLTGVDFICVRKEMHNKTLLPREFRDVEEI